MSKFNVTEKMKSKKAQSLIMVGLTALILVFINLLANVFNGHIDLTEEKRFTLTEPTKQQLKSLDDVVFVRVLLEGKFPAAIKHLQTSTLDMLEDFHSLNPLIEYKFEDPSVGGTAEEKKKRFEDMRQDGLIPMRLKLVDNAEKTEQYIYPFAEFNYKNRKVIVKLLEENSPGLSPDMALNNSVSLLEYKFSNAIQKLIKNDRPNIVFTEGHDELKKEETADLEKTLRAFFDTGRINLDSIGEIPIKTDNKVDILVIAKPKTAFTEKQKFQIDHYVMQGGKVIWLIDKLNADLAGMQKTGEMLPTEYPLNIDDILFKYGARINPNLVVDMQCARILLATGQAGNTSQYEPFSWYYYPIVAPSSKHPVVKSLDRVWLQFPSSIDTIRTKSLVNKTVILASSRTSRLQFTPTRLNFEILRYPADPTKFDKGAQPMALMLEGQFTSLFENRLTPEQLAFFAQKGESFTPLSIATKMLVVADGDVARNDFDAKQGTITPLGYNRDEKYKFANKDFLQNAIEYMLDDKGIIEARGKEVKLRLLDSVKAKDNRTMWQALNIVLPLAFIGLFGVFYFWRRKKTYGQSA